MCCSLLLFCCGLVGSVVDRCVHTHVCSRCTRGAVRRACLHDVNLGAAVRRREWLWVPLVYAFVVAWIYRDLWHHHGAATGLGWDTIDTHGPDLDFFARDLREGRFSLWNPYDKGGYPVFCDPVFDRYYPLNWPFAAWGALAGTGWWLVQLKVLAHHVIAGALLHTFLRSRGLSIRAALVGGIGLVASAPLVAHKASNILWPLVMGPDVLDEPEPRVRQEQQR